MNNIYEEMFAKDILWNKIWVDKVVVVPLVQSKRSHCVDAFMCEVASAPPIDSYKKTV